MPIYAYRCADCGHTKDVLQKLSDPPLTDCPACGAAAFSKQITAAGFQLKGSGWYATDFKGGSGGAKPADAKTDATKTEGAKDGGSKDGAGESKPSDSGGGSDAAPAAAGGCGTGCACH